MMKNIGSLVSILLAFQLNVEDRINFSSCDAISDHYAEQQCWAEVCGYGDDPTACAGFNLMYYAAVASKTIISIMVFIIFLIIVVIIENNGIVNSTPIT